MPRIIYIERDVLNIMLINEMYRADDENGIPRMKNVVERHWMKLNNA